MPAAPHDASPGLLDQRQVTLAVAFSALGWSFDLFDLFVLLYVAPALAHVFFASGRPMLSLAGVYAAFTATLLMRPAGGWVFGRYSDRRGRRRAMRVAALGVGVATALMGALPTVQSVGLLAPVLFVSLRLVQGVFMGGMVASTHTLGTESIAARRRGLASGIISGGGSGVGKLVASLVFLLVSALFPGRLYLEWGWRVMFFSGLLSSMLGLLVFSRVQESPLWEALQRSAAPAPAAPRPGLGGFAPTMLLCVVLTGAGGGLSYLTSGYLPTFLKLVNHVPPRSLGLMLSVSALGVIGASVLAGHLSDVLGRRPAMLLYGAASLLLLPLLYLGLEHAVSPLWVGGCAVLLSALGTFAYAPLMIVLNERFPTAIRASGTAVSWNIGFALGGSMPVLVSLLAHDPGGLVGALGLCIAVLAGAYLLAAWCVPARRNRMA